MSPTTILSFKSLAKAMRSSMLSRMSLPGRDDVQDAKGSSQVSSPVRQMFYAVTYRRCPHCGAHGISVTSRSPCRACGWEDPILEPWVPSGWYVDPANPERVSYWDSVWRGWSRRKPPKHAQAQPIPTAPPPGWSAETVVDAVPGNTGGKASGLFGDAPTTFRITRVVALVAAIMAGVLTAVPWYQMTTESAEENTSLPGTYGLWTLHPAIGGLIVAGAVFVVAVCAASLFRVPNDRPNLSPVVLGFAALVALLVVVSCVVGIGDKPAYTVTRIVYENTAWGALTLFVGLVMVASTTVMFVVGRRYMTGTSVSPAALASETAPPRDPVPIAPYAPRDATSALSEQGLIRDAQGDSLKRCPECAELVKDAARVCRYCGFRFAG